jgi:hypothetical protein
MKLYQVSIYDPSYGVHFRQPKAYVIRKSAMRQKQRLNRRDFYTTARVVETDLTFNGSVFLEV